MLSPAYLAPTNETGRVRTRSMSETTFIDLALRQLEERAIGCLLDSAGPLNARARHILLAGDLAGFFLQTEAGWTYRDLVRGTVEQLDENAFSLWLEQFRRLGLGPCGPALFPLLTYETWNPVARPAHSHPLWRLGHAVWLLAENSLSFDREAGLLTWCETRPQAALNFDQPQGRAVANFGWRESEAQYREKILLVQADIREGTFYQANLSQRFLGRTERPPLAIYRQLRALNPSPFMGVFRMGELWVLSGSPERLVELRDGALSARPIAGTKPRFADAAADEDMRRELTSSEKERAEHLMLLDLARNDLGRVAQTGTVHVDEFAQIETYSHVHHLVSQVSARLRTGVSLIEVIKSVFPGGTITGAPKIACMKRLAQLEGEARGPYTGSLGYIDTNGVMDLNILIRTLIQAGDLVCFHGGGGIVADSLPAAEYMETRHKCRVLMEALGIDC